MNVYPTKIFGLSLAVLLLSSLGCSNEKSATNPGEIDATPTDLAQLNQKIRSLAGAEKLDTIPVFEKKIDEANFNQSLDMASGSSRGDLKEEVANKLNRTLGGAKQAKDIKILEIKTNYVAANPTQEVEYQIDNQVGKATEIEPRRTSSFKIVELSSDSTGALEIKELNSSVPPKVYAAPLGDTMAVGFFVNRQNQKLVPIGVSDEDGKKIEIKSVAELLGSDDSNENKFYIDTNANENSEASTCGVTSHAHTNATGPGPQPTGPNFNPQAVSLQSRRSANVIIHTDRHAQDFFGGNRAELMDRIEATFLISTTSFENQTQITLRLQALVVDTAHRFPNAFDIFGLLAEFQNFWNTNSSLWYLRGTRNNITHFVTHRSFTSSGTVGLATLGGICNSQGGIVAGNYSLTANVTDFNSIVAHEMAHNIGASHCNGEPNPPIAGCGLMNWRNLFNYSIDLGTQQVFNSVAQTASASCLGTETVPIGSEALPFRSDFSLSGSLNGLQWRTPVNAQVVGHPQNLGNALRLNKYLPSGDDTEPQVTSSQLLFSNEGFPPLRAPTPKLLISSLGEAGSIAPNQLQIAFLQANNVWENLPPINLTNSTATSFGLTQLNVPLNNINGINSSKPTAMRLKSVLPPLQYGSQFLYINDIALVERPERLRTNLTTAPAITDGFGEAVDSIGDADGDGFDDYIVGVPYFSGSQTQEGKAVVYSGKTGAILHTLVGGAANAQFGRSVAGVGDWNADHYQDFAVGAPGIARVAVFSGLTGQEIASRSGPANSEFGFSVKNPFRSVGRVGTLLIGAPNGLNAANLATGFMELYRLNQSYSDFIVYGDQAFDRFGQSVAGGERSPTSPFFVGGSCFNQAGRAGYAKFVTTYTNYTPQTLTDSQLGKNFGCQVAAGPGMNTYGGLEFIVGNLADGVATRYQYHDSYGITTLGTLNFGSSFTSLAYVGDIDGDSQGDVALGKISSRMVKLFCGTSNTVCQDSFQGTSAGSSSTTYGALGAAIASAGDVNGDGVLDIIVGAPSPGTFPNNQGRVEIFTQRQRFLNLAPPKGTSTDSKFTNRTMSLSLRGFLRPNRNTFLDAKNIQGMQAVFLNFGTQIVTRPQHGGFMNLNSVVVPAGSIAVTSSPQGLAQIPFDLPGEYPGAFVQLIALGFDNKIYTSNILELSLQLAQ